MNREQRRKAQRMKKEYQPRVFPGEQEYLSDEEKSALCLQCHACCKQLPMSIKYDPESPAFQAISEFFTTHGCEAMMVHGVYVISVPHICQHLTESGCDIYESRPTVCRDYDGRKDPRLLNKCLWVKRGGMTTAAGYADRAEVKLD
jgi:hypothetical protein